METDYQQILEGIGAPAPMSKGSPSKVNVAMETIGAVCETINSASVFQSAVAVAGDSLTPKEHHGVPYLFDGWVNINPTAVGIIRLRGGRVLHNRTDGFRFKRAAGDLTPFFEPGEMVPLIAGEALTPQIASADAASDQHMLAQSIIYVGESAPNQNMISYDQLQSIKRQFSDYSLVTVESATMTASVTKLWGGTVALDNTSGIYNLNDGEAFAVLGMISNVDQSALAIRGPDSSQLRWAVPGESSKQEIGQYYFLRHAKATPTIRRIPVFYTKNRSQTFFETLNNEIAASPIITLVLARIK